MPGPKTKFDPLEAAKVTDASQAVDEAAAGPFNPQPRPPISPAPAPAPSPPAPKVAKPAKAAPAAKRTVYKVIEAKVVSLGGGYTDRLKVGTILDPAGYGGEAGIQRMIDNGLKLEKVEI